MKWSQLRRHEKQFLLVAITPITLIMVIALIVFVAVDANAGILTQALLMFVWMVGAFTYIAVDSKSRWPKVNTFQRLAYVITFKR